MSFWNRIINWFKDLSEREKLINDFNTSARSAFTQLTVDTLLEARSKRGDRDFRHEFSHPFLPTGFCIRATKGSALSKEEIIYIAKVILNNEPLVRRLFVLGWDTFYVEDIIGKKQAKWAIKEFTNLGLMLNVYNGKD